MRDVTVKKAAEIERAELLRQLIQAQRMDTLGALAGGIAHDLNNILAAIFGFTEVALASGVSDDAKHYHRQVLKASERARELVKRILSFSRLHEPERSTVRLQDLITETAKFIRAALPVTVALDLRLDGSCPATLVDANQLHQVLLNLATNAAHAIGERHGQLLIALRRQDLDASVSTACGILPPGPYAVVTVEDDGRGMDAATRARMFEPFFTTKKEGEGTGLGLSVVSAIVAGHGGGVLVESEVGRGTKIHVHLPLVPQVDVMASAPEVPLTPLPRGRGETVEIIDDEIAVVAAGEKMLQGLGYLATAYTTADRFLAAYLTAPEGIDLIITDQTMPKMTGLELAFELRRHKHTVPLLIMTGFSAQIQPPIIANIRRAARARRVNRESRAVICQTKPSGKGLLAAPLHATNPRYRPPSLLRAY